MTPVIQDIIDEVMTSEGAEYLRTAEDFDDWILTTKWRMNANVALRFEFPNFKLYSTNPGYYWPFIERHIKS